MQNGGPMDCELLKDPRFTRNNSDSIIETYQKLHILFVEWFLPYEKVNNIWVQRTKYRQDNKNELHDILYQFFQLYQEFEQSYCTSDILQDAICSNCQKGLGIDCRDYELKYQKHNELKRKGPFCPDRNITHNMETIWFCDHRLCRFHI